MSGVVPCFSHTAAALAGLTGKEADEKILKAALADARETLAAVFRALLSDLEAERRTREADEAGTLEAMPRPAWTPPPGAVPAPLTMVIEVDGKGFPCARKDLKGRRGRDGGAVRMRGANAIVIKW